MLASWERGYLRPERLTRASGKLASRGEERGQKEGERSERERGRANDPPGARLNLFTGISVKGTLCPARQIRTMRVSFRANLPPRRPDETLCIKMKRSSWKFRVKFHLVPLGNEQLLNVAPIFPQNCYSRFGKFCGFSKIAFEIFTRASIQNAY